MGSGSLKDLKFGFRDERYYPASSMVKEGKLWVECIHWVISHHCVGRLLASQSYPLTSKFLLSIHTMPDRRKYYEDPREALQSPNLTVAKWDFEGLDPLLIVSIVEEWKKQEPLKYVEVVEAAVLSLPS